MRNIIPISPCVLSEKINNITKIGDKERKQVRL